MHQNKQQDFNIDHQYFDQTLKSIGFALFSKYILTILIHQT